MPVPCSWFELCTGQCHVACSVCVLHVVTCVLVIDTSSFVEMVCLQLQTAAVVLQCNPYNLAESYQLVICYFGNLGTSTVEQLLRNNA